MNNINPDDLLPDELKKYIIDSSKEWFAEDGEQHRVLKLSKGRKIRNIYIVNRSKK